MQVRRLRSHGNADSDPLGRADVLAVLQSHGRNRRCRVLVPDHHGNEGDVSEHAELPDDEWTRMIAGLTPEQVERIKAKCAWEHCTWRGVFRDWPSLFEPPTLSVSVTADQEECGCAYEVLPGGVHPERRYFHEPDCPRG